MFYDMITCYYLCKLTNKRKKDIDRKPHDQITSRSLHQMCRVCLKQGTVPIFGDNSAPDISLAVSKFGDIKINKNDNYPKSLCDSCYRSLKAAVLFQRMAKETDNALKRLPRGNIKSSCSNLYKSLQTSSNVSNLPELENLPNIDSEDDLSQLNPPLPSMSESKYQNKKETSLVKKQAKPPSPTLSENFTYYCSENEFSDNNEPKVKVSLSSQPRTTRVQCKICSKIVQKGSAKSHLDLHSQTRNYMCDICGKSYNQKSSYYIHSFIHSTNFGYKCQLCPYRTNAPGNLKSHIHTHRDYKYLCTECPKKFMTMSNLKKHLLTHNKSGKSFKCNECEKLYYNKRDLQIHIEVVHLAIKKYNCDLCGIAFGYKKSVRDHKFRVHKTNKMQIGRTPLYLRLPQEVIMQDQNKTNLTVFNEAKME